MSSFVNFMLWNRILILKSQLYEGGCSTHSCSGYSLPKGFKFKPSLHATLVKANMEAKFLFAFWACHHILLAGAAHPGDTLWSTLVQRHFGRCVGEESSNIAHEVAPDEGLLLKQQLYVQQAVGTTWNKLYTHKHTHTKREVTWLHWYVLYVCEAFSSTGLNAV